MNEPSNSGQKSSRPLCITELRRNAHVLVLQELRTRFTDAGSPSRTAALDAAVAALSAQPSPGGQDALVDAARRVISNIDSGDYRGEISEATYAALEAALAARQPEGEPITVEAVAEIFNHPEYGLSISWLLENGIGELQVGDVLMVSDRAITDEDGSGKVYTAPPAQQSAQVHLDDLDRALGETIDQRDRYHEVADELAARIAAITGVDIGEHSSANCPWQNAIEAAEANQPAQAVDPGQTFQAGVAEWMGQCFLPSLHSNMTERGDRLLEEVLELLQAHGYDSARVPTLVDYVFGRPVGEPAQEVGGVMVTLAGYCWVAGLDMHAAGDAELDRINQPEVMARIRAKQEAKNDLHFDTPLPGNAAAPPAQAVDLGEMPEGWRLSKKATCYQLSHGNDIIGNLVGPDAEENAAIIARVLDSQAVGK